MDYLRRTTDKLLRLNLDTFGAVLIEGPKWCGKTTTAERQAKSVLKLQDPDTREAFLATAAVKPSLLLKGETPRLIDEWQVAPVLWDAVRTAVDERNEVGQFILTGSNTVDRAAIMHSGTGRIARMQMYPMSLFESEESNGKISLLELFNNPSMDIDGITSDMTIENLIFAACRGGWPATIKLKTDDSRLRVAADYVNTVCKVDISSIDNVSRDATLARLILRAYARNLSTLAKKKEIYKDVNANMECSEKTFDDYVAALIKLYVIEDIEAWSPAIRSASAIRNGLKRGFVDPSIAVASLGLTPQSLEQDLRTFGFIFECMCIRDLKAYSQAMDGTMAYYHDRYDLEADGVLHLGDGRYALIEFKLGSKEIEEGAAHLLKIKELVNEFNKTNPQIKLRLPDLLMVVTGGVMAYSRPDGVKVIPLACLRD
jgi:predicted AAA+ superfamily ATPase